MSKDFLRIQIDLAFPLEDGKLDRAVCVADARARAKKE